MERPSRSLLVGAGLGMGMAMAAAAAGALSGSLPVLRPERERFTILDDAAGPRRNRDRANKKLKAKLGKQRSRRQRSAGGGGARWLRTEEQALVQGMTNWQRSQWAKAGYPGLANGNIDFAKVRPFAEMRRRSDAEAA